MSREIDNTPCYVYHCPNCGGLLAAYVADLNDAETMKAALKFKRDSEKRGRAVTVATCVEVRAAKWCSTHRQCQRRAKAPAQVELELA